MVMMARKFLSEASEIAVWMVGHRRGVSRWPSHLEVRRRGGYLALSSPSRYRPYRPSPYYFPPYFSVEVNHPLCVLIRSGDQVLNLSLRHLSTSF